MACSLYCRISRSSFVAMIRLHELNSSGRASKTKPSSAHGKLRRSFHWTPRLVGIVRCASLSCHLCFPHIYLRAAFVLDVGDLQSLSLSALWNGYTVGSLCYETYVPSGLGVQACNGRYRFDDAASSSHKDPLFHFLTHGWQQATRTA